MERELEPYQRVERSIQKKFRKSIWVPFIAAVKRYELIQENDTIAVCISGGKDSMLMAKLMQLLQRYSEVPFEVVFLVMDPGYSSENRRVIEENARKLNIPIHIFESNIFDYVYNVDKSPCYLCARMRRGHLYDYARRLGCNKIALGHHYDDVIETILMGMLYGAQVQTMMPKLHSTNFPGMELIRPLYLIREDDIKAWRDANELHFIQCACYMLATGLPTGVLWNIRDNTMYEVEIPDRTAFLNAVVKCITKGVYTEALAYNLEKDYSQSLDTILDRVMSDTSLPEFDTGGNIVEEKPQDEGVAIIKQGEQYVILDAGTRSIVGGTAVNGYDTILAACEAYVKQNKKATEESVNKKELLHVIEQWLDDHAEFEHQMSCVAVDIENHVGPYSGYSNF